MPPPLAPPRLLRAAFSFAGFSFAGFSFGVAIGARFCFFHAASAPPAALAVPLRCLFAVALKWSATALATSPLELVSNSRLAAAEISSKRHTSLTALSSVAVAAVAVVGVAAAVTAAAAAAAVVCTALMLPAFPALAAAAPVTPTTAVLHALSAARAVCCARAKRSDRRSRTAGTDPCAVAAECFEAVGRLLGLSSAKPVAARLITVTLKRRPRQPPSSRNSLSSGRSVFEVQVQGRE